MDLLPAELFLDAYPEPMREIAERLRRIVRAAVPDSLERVRPGWRIIGYDVPLGRRSRYFAFVLPESRHVHLGFAYGALMTDAAGLLEGAGVTKRVRWVTFRPGDAIPARRLEPLVRQAAQLALLPGPARLDAESARSIPPA
jgi:hypothetical protein